MYYEGVLNEETDMVVHVCHEETNVSPDLELS